MGLDNLFTKTVDSILKPTQEEIAFWNQTVQTTLGGAIQAGREILEKTLSEYDSKSLSVIEKGIEFLSKSGFANLMSAYFTSRNIGETATDYRMQREITDMVVRRILGGITSNINPYAGELISRGGRDFESSISFITSGIISYLKNNGVKNPEKFVNAYIPYVGLLGNSLVKLYENLREIYTPKGIKLKLSGLNEPLREYNDYFMYENIKETINNILSKIETEKKEGGEAVKESPKEEQKIEEELKEKPPAPYEL